VNQGNYGFQIFPTDARKWIIIIIIIIIIYETTFNINMPAYYHGPLWDYHQRILINKFYLFVQIY